ncbi:MAG: DUF5667 domain-containing protein [Candidatus Woesebacteria bacterium]|jgi:hypothetical protein
MKNLRFIASIGALLFGIAIVAASLSSASIVQGQEETVSQKKLYWSQTILPDHIFYPFVAAADRIKLEIASPSEKPYLQIEYANRRLAYSKELLEKGNQGLALTTLTKSQKYLIFAVQEAIDNDQAPALTKKYLKDALEQHMTEVKNMISKFSASERDVIEKLCAETQTLKEQLESEIK